MSKKGVWITKRQLVGLFVSLVLFFAIIFVLGVKVGKNTCTCPQTLIAAPEKIEENQTEKANKLAGNSAPKSEQKTAKVAKKNTQNVEEKSTKSAIKTQQNINQNTKENAQKIAEKPLKNEAKNSPKAEQKTQKNSDKNRFWSVQIGAYKTLARAKKHLKLKPSIGGLKTYIVKEGGGFKVRVGKFKSREDALKFMKEHRLNPPISIPKPYIEPLK